MASNTVRTSVAAEKPGRAESMTRVLVVCTGNTCRSPLMAALAQRDLTLAGRQDVTVESAGTGASQDEPASQGTRLALARRGLSVDRHHSRNTGDLDLAGYDHIWCMTTRHAAAIRATGVPPQKISVINAAHGGIPDPFGGDDDAYEACAQALESALPSLLATIP